MSTEEQILINNLMSEVKMRNNIIAEETKQRYEAYKRIIELQAEISELKKKLDCYG